MGEGAGVEGDKGGGGGGKRKRIRNRKEERGMDLQAIKLVSTLSTGTSDHSNYGCTGLETLFFAPAGEEMQTMEPEHKLLLSTSCSPHL